MPPAKKKAPAKKAPEKWAIPDSPSPKGRKKWGKLGSRPPRISDTQRFLFGGRQRPALGDMRAIAAIGVDSRFDLAAEMADKPLDRPRGGVAERADRVAFNLPRDIEQLVDFGGLGVADRHALQNAPHPAGALAAGRALAAAFMLVKIRDAGDRAHDIGRLVHNDDRRRTEPRAHVAQRIEIHQHIVADFLRQQRHRGAARNDGFQILPPAADSAAVRADKRLQGDRHRLFDIARTIDVTGNAKDLGAGVVRPSEPGEPFGAATQDRRRDRNRFDIVDRRRAAIKSGAGRKRRLQARLALLALKAFKERGFLAANISAGAVMDKKVEIKTRPAGVLADQSRRIGFIDRLLQGDALVDIFAAKIDVAGLRLHREGGDEAAFDQKMRIVTHDVAILAGAGLGFVGVDDEIMRPVFDLFRHEGPFESGRESGAAAAAQARILNLLDDPVRPHADDVGGRVPRAAFLRRFKTGVLKAVEVCENAVFILKESHLLCASCWRLCARRPSFETPRLTPRLLRMRSFNSFDINALILRRSRSDRLEG